jgi:hypothetical protein
MPAGHLGTRRMGDLAELAFMYRASMEGIGVARPYGDSYPYDAIVQHGSRLLRIQVKSCFSYEKRRYTGFPIVVASHWRGQQKGYSPDDVDFIAAYIARHDAWYLIPMEALGNLKNIRLYPTGRTLKRPGGRFECYREAWHLLKQQKHQVADIHGAGIQATDIQATDIEQTEETHATQSHVPDANDANVHNFAVSTQTI